MEQELWNIIEELVNHFTNGMDTKEALGELLRTDLTYQMLIRLGFSESDIDEADGTA